LAAVLAIAAIVITRNKKRKQAKGF
jgi:hypothetical protein